MRCQKFRYFLHPKIQIILGNSMIDYQVDKMICPIYHLYLLHAHGSSKIGSNDLLWEQSLNLE
jgi:hypothetical protein